MLAEKLLSDKILEKLVKDLVDFTERKFAFECTVNKKSQGVQLIMCDESGDIFFPVSIQNLRLDDESEDTQYWSYTVPQTGDDLIDYLVHFEYLKRTNTIVKNGGYTLIERKIKEQVI